MKSLADALPPDIAQQIDPDWRKNEAACLAVRDQLLGQDRGQWIGFAEGGVVAVGSSPRRRVNRPPASESRPPPVTPFRH